MTTKPSKKAFSYKDLIAACEAYVQEDAPKATDPVSVANIMRPLLQTAEQESFWVLMLDTKHRVREIHEATRGLVDRSQVHAREIFREAIRHNSSRIVLSHNHPSGDPTPSAQDIACTRDLVAAGKIIGIDVLDHVIIGTRTTSRNRDYLSFKEEGLL